MDARSITIELDPLPSEAGRRFTVEARDHRHIVVDRTTGDPVYTWAGECAMSEPRARDAAAILERNHHGLGMDRLILVPAVILAPGVSDGRSWSVFTILPPWTDRVLLARAIAAPETVPPPCTGCGRTAESQGWEPGFTHAPVCDVCIVRSGGRVPVWRDDNR